MKKLLVWSIVIVLVLVELSALFMGNFFKNILSEEPLLAVMAYSEPWRTMFGVIIIFAALLIQIRIKSTITEKNRLLTGISLIGIASIPLIIIFYLNELIVLNVVTGKIYKHRMFYETQEIDLLTTQDGICVNSQFYSRFIWKLNGHILKLPILPLPLDNVKFRKKLSAKKPENCQ